MYCKNIETSSKPCAFTILHIWFVFYFCLVSIAPNQPRQRLQTTPCPDPPSFWSPISLFTPFHTSPRGISSTPELPVLASVERHHLHKKTTFSASARSPSQSPAALSPRFNDGPSGPIGVLRRLRRLTCRDVLRVQELAGAAGWSRWMLTLEESLGLLMLICVCCFWQIVPIAWRIYPHRIGGRCRCWSWGRSGTIWGSSSRSVLKEQYFGVTCMYGFFAVSLHVINKPKST